MSLRGIAAACQLAVTCELALSCADPPRPLPAQTAAPLVASSPEFETDPWVASPLSVAFTGDVASNGVGFWVVWVARTGVGKDDVIVAYSFDGGAPPLSSYLSVAGPQGSGRRWPRIASDGQDFLITWQENEPGRFVSSAFARRMNADGGLPDVRPFVVASPFIEPNAAAALAHDGTNWWLVAATGGTGLRDIFAARVSNSGVPLDPAGIDIATHPGDDRSPSIASNGRFILVAWERLATAGNGGNGETAIAKVLPNGTVLDLNGIGLGNDGGIMHNVTTDGVGFWVTRTDGQPGDGRIATTWVDADGGVGLTHRVSDAGTAGQYEVAVNFVGPHLLMFWRGGSDVAGATVTPPATTTTEVLLPTPAGFSLARTPRVATSATQSMLVWEFSGGGNGAALRAAAVDRQTGAPGPLFFAAQGPNVQTNPFLSSDDGGAWLVWQDGRSGGPEITLMKFGADAGSVEVAPAPATNGMGFEQNGGQSISWGDRVGLVTWTNRFGAVQGRLFQPNGNLGFTLFFGSGVFPPARAPSAWDSVGFLVVVGRGEDVFATRQMPDGGVSPSMAVIATPAREGQPELAALGDMVLIVARQDLRGVVAARWRADAGLLDTAPLLLADAGPVSSVSPAVAAEASGWRVAWVEQRDAGHALVSAHVDVDGGVQSPRDWVTGRSIPPTGGPGLAVGSEAALAAWLETTDAGHQLWACFELLDGGRDVPTLLAAPIDGARPSVAAVAPNTFVVAYQAPLSSPTQYAERVRLRWLQHMPGSAGCDGGTCCDGGSCMTLACDGGACCDGGPCVTPPCDGGACCDGGPCVTQPCDGGACCDGGSCSAVECDAGSCCDAGCCVTTQACGDAGCTGARCPPGEPPYEVRCGCAVADVTGLFLGMAWLSAAAGRRRRRGPRAHAAG